MVELYTPLDRWILQVQHWHNDRRQRVGCRCCVLGALMLSVKEAFQKFRSRLELTEREQSDASRRQKEIRGEEADCCYWHTNRKRQQ